MPGPAGLTVRRIPRRGSQLGQIRPLPFGNADATFLASNQFDDPRRSSGMAVPIPDVARRAGVSRSTVSYVLSGSRPISPETRLRVEPAIEALPFRPHA